MTARRALMLIPLILILIGAGWWLGPSRLATPDVPTAEVVRGPFQITLTVTGELEAVNSVVVTAPSAGGSKKITMLAKEGARVAEGDVVVSFDTTDFVKEVRLAENDLAVIETRLIQQEAKGGQDLSQLDTSIARAHLAMERAQLSLTDSETVARIERERARITVEEATLDLEKLTSDRELKEQDLKSERRLLELEKDKVETRLERARQALDGCTIRAPTSGLVILAKAWKGSGWGTVEEGDSVWPGQTVLQIPDLSTLQAVVQVHEVDASLVAVGQQSTLSLDAFPGPVYSAEVSQIANLATTIDRGSKVKYFKTLLKVQETDETMKPGMTTKVEIQVETLDDVLSVPREAIFDGDDGPQVFTQSTMGFTPRPVELGKTNATHAVILSGVEAGEKVALSDPLAKPAASPAEGASGAKPGGV